MSSNEPYVNIHKAGCAPYAEESYVRTVIASTGARNIALLIVSQLRRVTTLRRRLLIGGYIPSTECSSPDDKLS